MKRRAAQCKLQLPPVRLRSPAACKFMDSAGVGYASAAIQCIQYCTTNKARIIQVREPPWAPRLLWERRQLTSLSWRGDVPRGCLGRWLAGWLASHGWLCCAVPPKRAPLPLLQASWSGGGFSQAMKDAIKAAGDAGVLFISSAGNSNTDLEATPNYPPSYKLANQIVVGSSG